MVRHFQTEAEIQAVVQGLESCYTAKDDFPHHKHLAVACWYLREGNVDAAFEKMRSSLLRFLGHHEVEQGKYKDELTRAWIRLVQSELNALAPELTFVAKTNEVIERLRDPRIVFERYPENSELQDCN